MSVKEEKTVDESMIDTKITEEASIASTALGNDAMDVDEPNVDAEEDEDDELDADEEDEDDPIVKSIPINMTSLAYPINVFQYPTKPKKIMGTKTELHHPHIATARMKPNSKHWQLEIPLEQNVFFDKEGSEEKWPNSNVETQVLDSVTVEEKGQYVAFYRDDQLYLLPVDSVGQFRPLFKHIDDQNNTSNQQAAAASAGGPSSSKSTVVTMSVKSSSEANQNRLGGALLAQKIDEEETFKDLHWVDHTFEQFKETVMTEECKKKVGKKCSRDEYFTKLL